ncbi:hypothetical protein B0O80DRAFT_442335 [Mortierella sp. GBAus27b]|nr:hypothetical protein B0O80DRAFT_442335 [Mortierella sp. GBAus27b]
MTRIQALQFYSALEKAKSVYELCIVFGWGPSYNDFKDLRNTLYKTNIGILELPDVEGIIFIGDVLNRSRQYTPILDIMRYSSIKSMTFEAEKGFFARANLLARKDDFSNLRHLSMSIESQDATAPNLRHLLSKAPNLASLTLDIDMNDWVEAHNGIVEYQTYPITMKQRYGSTTVQIPPPATESRGPTRALKDIDELFSVYARYIEQLAIGRYGGYCPSDPTMETIAEQVPNGSRLTSMVLSSRRRQSERCIRSLARIISNAKLRSLHFDLYDDNLAWPFEWISWNHIRALSISLSHAGQLAGVMMALLSGMETTESGMLKLETFGLAIERERDSRDREVVDHISLDGQELLRLFISPMLFKSLRLDIPLYPSQVFDLLESIDMSGLQKLCLKADGFKWNEVQVLLDILQRATELRTMLIPEADITADQKKLIEAKGIRLRDW